jgi:ComF family protein
MLPEVVAAFAEALAPDGCFLCTHPHDPVLAADFPPERYARSLLRPVQARLLGVRLGSHPVCPSCAGCLREARRPVTLESGHRLVSPFLDSPELVKLIHLLKFNGLKGMASLLGAAMARAQARQAPVPAESLLVPVPMDASSRRKRGFNQAALLAEAAGAALGIPVAGRALVKLRRTRAQSLTAEDDRDENVRGAFGKGGESVRGRSVVIVDDLVTTGATVIACATVLEAAGAAEVSVLAAGRARAARGAAAAPGGESPRCDRERYPLALTPCYRAGIIVIYHQFCPPGRVPCSDGFHNQVS